VVWSVCVCVCSCVCVCALCVCVVWCAVHYTGECEALHLTLKLAQTALPELIPQQHRSGMTVIHSCLLYIYITVIC